MAEDAPAPAASLQSLTPPPPAPSQTSFPLSHEANGASPASQPALQERGGKEKRTSKKRKKGKIQTYLEAVLPLLHGVPLQTGKRNRGSCRSEKRNTENGHQKEAKGRGTQTAKRWKRIMRLESDLSTIYDQLYDLPYPSWTERLKSDIFIKYHP